MVTFNRLSLKRFGGMTRKVYSDEFKKEILAKAAAGEKISELAKLHD